jgi:hypothetical protein
MSKIYLLLILILVLSIFSSASSKKNCWKLDLLPNKEYEIENPFPFIFEEKCKIIYTNPADKISIKVLKGKAFANSKEISSTELNFIDNENQKKWKGRFALETNTTLIIQNSGENLIKLKCKLRKTKKTLNSHIEVMELFKKNNFKISEDIDLNPNSPYTFKNPLLFSVSVTCNVSCPASESLFGQVSNGSASVNGKDIPAEGLSLTVNNGDNFGIHASRLASGSITNQGKELVHAKCSLGAKELSTEEFEQSYNQLLVVKKILETHEAYFNDKKNKKEENKEEENHEKENNEEENDEEENDEDEVDEEKFETLKFLA